MRTRIDVLTATLVAAATALACGPARALADVADPTAPPAPSARAWTTRSLTFAFFDAFLGAPKNGLRDDNGFVCNLRLMGTLPDGEGGLLRLGLSEQLITERRGHDRVDDGRLYATWLRHLGTTPDRGLTLGWTLGLQVVGDLGGANMQDLAHHTVFSGRRLDGQGARALQDRYPRDYDVLADVGGLAMITQPLGGSFSLREGVEGLVGLGTGYFGELHPFVAIVYATSFVEIELREAAGIYGTDVRPLTINGGYVTGRLQSQPSVHASVFGPRWFPSILTFDLEWNQGDTHQHVGGFTVGARF